MGGTSQTHLSASIGQNFTPPRTPPWSIDGVEVISNWPEPETYPEGEYLESSFGGFEGPPFSSNVNNDDEPSDTHQNVLLLHAAKQRYVHSRHLIPHLKFEREMLIEVQAIGLNPIDWKAPDFGFGLPALPCISGRDMAGRVVKAPEAESRFRVGDTVIGISTDYRDSRKSAFQQYAVVTDFNACKVPKHLSILEAAPLGVAYVAAALALGICMGMNFVSQDGSSQGPDLLQVVNALPKNALPEDIRKECFEGITREERVNPGDWIAVWGGSSATGCCAVQLAKLAGLKVISVIDIARSGDRMLKHGADLLVDRIDTKRAIEVIKGVTKGKLRFALDTQGRDSASLLAQALQHQDIGNRSHLVGLVGLPKEATNGVIYHTVPIKAFHEAPAIGEGMTTWLEDLLSKKLIKTHEIEVADGGLEGVNTALDRLRNGTVNGPRIVVPLLPSI